MHSRRRPSGTSPHRSTSDIEALTHVLQRDPATPTDVRIAIVVQNKSSGNGEALTTRPKVTGVRPRLIDVAAASGVTVSIASRVLNGDPTVSARNETRERIFEAARQLAYIPNALARGLRQSRTMTMGVVLPNLAYAVNAEIISGSNRGGPRRKIRSVDARARRAAE